MVAISTRRMLEEHGHQVKVFAMSHPDNLKIPDACDYAPQVDFSKGIQQKIAGASRIFGFGEVRKRFEKVIDDFKPDVVHLHNIHSYISPVVGEIAYKKGIRVVWTLHDYKLLCPAYLFRTPDGNNCEACIRGHLRVAPNRCMKGSLLQSLLGDLEARFWSHRRLLRHTDLFIAPSNFMRNKMMEGGYSPSKIVTICNFVDPYKLDLIRKGNPNDPARKKENYFCYAGRLSEEKGVETMLKAALNAEVKLKVAGGGPLEASLRQKYGKFPNIEFLGLLSPQQVVELIEKAKAMVMPSEWHENNPLTVIEALCAGTPVIGAAIGGIPELLSPSNGILFTSGNAEELERILHDFDIRHSFDHEEIARQAQDKFNEDTHYVALMKAYGKTE